MAGVHNFLDKRQHAHTDSQRQALAHLHKVPVPATRLEYTGRRPLARKPSTTLVANISSSHLLHKSGFHPAQTSHDHDAGFDTDAQSLDDTTVTSAGYDKKGQHVDEDGISRESYLRSHATGGNPRNVQNPAQLAADVETVVKDTESYEESEDEESNVREVDEDRHFQKRSPPTLLQELNSPGYPHYHQQANDFSKEAAFKQVMDSPSLRNFSFANLTKRNAGNQFRSTRGPNQPRDHDVGDNSNVSDVDVQGQDQRRTPPGTNQLLPSKFQQQSLAAVKQSCSRAPPSSLRKTRSVLFPLSQQHARPLSPQPSSLPQPHRIQIETNRGYCDSNGSVLSCSQNDTMPPLMYTDGDGEHENPLGAGPNASHETINASKGFAGLRNDDFSSGEEQGLDKVYEQRSTAVAKHSATRKHGISLDYSLAQLADMDFNQLSAQAFYLDPQRRDVLPSPIAGGTLIDKLDYLVKLQNYDAKASHQRAFLASLPMEEYEKCGDIIVERFSDFVKTFKHARQQRRRIAKDFEDEVAKREERVRLQIEAYEKDFGRLKRGGEDVVRQKLAL